MSVVPVAVVRTWAESIGLASLSDDLLRALAQDVEYRAREVLQDAQKYAAHGKRTRLTASDVNAALQAANAERLYGYDGGEPLSFVPVPNSALFVVRRETVDLESIVGASLPRASPPLTLSSHWLAVDGVTPDVPENAVSHVAPQAPSVPALAALQDDAETRPPARHVLSRELQAYHDAVVGDLASGSADRVRAALYSVATDAGLQQLLPYLVAHVAEGVPRALKSVPQLHVLIGLLSSLLANEQLFLEPYLHQAMPPLLSCLLCRKLGSPGEDHWPLRERCAAIVADVCRRFGHAYATLVPRVARTMISALTSERRSPSAVFGAVVGLSALGVAAVESGLVPNAERIASDLEGASEDATRVRSALRAALSRWIAETDNAIDAARLSTQRQDISAILSRLPQ